MKNLSADLSESIVEKYIGTQKIPTEPLLDGEQYRFHFNSEKCISCEACVVACSEQNNNPADVFWRKVGEVESGVFPYTKRSYLSMSCNHCIEPTCMKGCPTGAYVKDAKTGIVLHDANMCIGCQYCIWNCPYGAPQYNAERGVVTKCNMCYDRLTNGQQPSCVETCPENAILIEKININDWRNNHAEADAPGMPDANITISSTKITLPQNMINTGNKVNTFRIKPEHPHSSLVFFLVFTQVIVGLFISLFSFEVFTGYEKSLKNFFANFYIALAISIGFTMIFATLHLGRPLHAYRALKMWRTSWLSREVLFFGLFLSLVAWIAIIEADSLYFQKFLISKFILFTLKLLSSFVGLIAVLCSAYIYMTPARPSWNVRYTVVRFFMTSFILGPLVFITSFLSFDRLKNLKFLLYSEFFMGLAAIIIAVSLTLTFLLSGYFIYLLQSEKREFKNTAIMLMGKFRLLFFTRLLLLLVGGVVLPAILIGGSWAGSNSYFLFLISLIASINVMIAEILGRYLFFITVVPENIAGGFFE